MALKVRLKRTLLLKIDLIKMELKISNNQLVDGQIPYGSLHEGITSLNLLYCRSLTQLPDLPDGITHLNLRGCRSLTQLPALPDGITNLDLYDCRSLTQLPDLPAGLAYLNLGYCRSLTHLPDLPDGLTNLDLRGCTNLQPTPELIAQLDEIERRHVDSYVTRPEHWRARDMIGQAAGGGAAGAGIDDGRAELAGSIDAITARLNEVVTSSDVGSVPIYNPDTDTTRHVYPLLDIFNRFTTQNIRHGDRRLEDIVATVTPIVELLENDSSHLVWMNAMAAHYMQGCVNQPVQAFIEIAGFAGVCLEDTIAGKMEATKAISARIAILDFFAKLSAGERTGLGVEVEFGNVMISKVHQEFLKEGQITKPWPGIPGKVAYQGMVEGAVERRVGDACMHVKNEALDLPHEEIANRLLGFLEGGAEGKDPPYRHVALAWMAAMLKGNPRLEAKSKEIDEKYEEERQLHESELEFLAFAEKVNESGLERALRIYADDPNKDEFETRYKEEFTGTPGEKAQKLAAAQMEIGSNYASIDSRKEQARVDLIKSVSSAAEVASAAAAAPAPDLPPATSRRRSPSPSARPVGVVTRVTAVTDREAEFEMFT